MAKIQDKLYNRVIEGELLEITEEEKSKLGLGGGTKLYLHYVRSSDAKIDEVLIVSPSSIPLTSMEGISGIRNKGYWNSGRDTGYFYFFDHNGSQILFTQYYLAGGQLGVEVISETVDFDKVTDTVTPIE